MKKKNMAGAIGSVMIIMIVSRLLALLSSSIYMSVFGTDSVYINIYSYAINIPNIIFTCIGTALSTVVIPIYVGHRAVGEEREAKHFADNIITVSVVLTLILVIAGICVSPLLVSITGFNESHESRSYAIKSLMIVMPVMFFYGLNYIFQGMLQSSGRFKLPAFVSVPSSLVVIGYVYLLSDRFGVTGLLIATVAGLSLQAIILIPPLYKDGYRYKPCMKLKDSDVVNAGKMAVPVLFGVGSYQLNMLFNSTMISHYGMVTILQFVQNITVQMVLTFIYSITAVIYPKLSESAAKGNMDEYKETLSGILKSVIVLLVPISIGYISVREPLMNLLVGWGKMQPDDIKKAETLVLLYAVGLAGVGLKEVLDRAFYSIKNTKVSAVNGFVIMAANIALSFCLMPFIGAYGIPLAYSLASIIGAVNLFLQLRRKIGAYADGFFRELVKSLICAAIMFLCVFVIIGVLRTVLYSNSVISRLVILCIPAGTGAIVYFAMGFVLKIEAVQNFASKLFKRNGGDING